MQLVLSGKRVIAHGENFLAMGGVVINTKTGAKYENATIAECNGCPSDIDKVGYEYHGGVFTPCAPYGTGNNNGFFMEVCETCATPRSSGIPINTIKFVKIAGVSVSCSQSDDDYSDVIEIPLSDDTLLQYESLRYVIKKGSSIDFGSDFSFYRTVCLYAGASTDDDLLIFEAIAHDDSPDKILVFDEDYEIKKTFRVGSAYENFSLTDGNYRDVIISAEKSTAFSRAEAITVKADYGVAINLDIEIRGRKI